MIRRAALSTGGIALLLTVALAAGCEAVGFKGMAPADAPAAADWPFAPVAMRVHPFTELVRDDGAGPWMLEARIELLDQLGDVTKGVGNWRFELYAPGRPGEGRQRLELWQASMTELEENERHYDPITRTYAFKLRLDEEPRTDRPLTFVAQLTNPQGRRLLAEGEVEWDGDE